MLKKKWRNLLYKSSNSKIELLNWSLFWNVSNVPQKCIVSYALDVHLEFKMCIQSREPFHTQKSQLKHYCKIADDVKLTANMNHCDVQCDKKISRDQWTHTWATSIAMIKKRLFYITMKYKWCLIIRFPLFHWTCRTMFSILKLICVFLILEPFPFGCEAGRVRNLN